MNIDDRAEVTSDNQSFIFTCALICDATLHVSLCIICSLTTRQPAAPWVIMLYLTKSQALSGVSFSPGVCVLLHSCFEQTHILS